MYIVFSLTMALAHPDCEQPMRLRGMNPSLDSVAPTDTRLWFGSVGSGTAEHFTLHLYLNDEEISGSTESSCYIHEGPLDNHCNLVFSPDEPLQPNTYYRYRAAASEEHMNPAMFVDSAFTTTEDFSSISSTPATLNFTGYQFRDITNEESCKWPNSYQHNFLIELPSSLPYDSIIQVYEVKLDGSNILVHTLFLPTGDQVIDFRQVVVPGDEGEHCYFVQQEDIAGNKADPSNIVCFDPFAPDEPAAEPAAEDTAVEEDSGQNVSNTENLVEEPKGSSCQHIPAPLSWVGVGLLLLVSFQRKKTEQ